MYGGPGVKVAVDGRVDLYGSQYVQDYLRTLNMRNNFEGALAELDPNVALLRRDTALVWFLQNEKGWYTQGTQSDFILLVRDRG